MCGRRAAAASAARARRRRVRAPQAAVTVTTHDCHGPVRRVMPGSYSVGVRLLTIPTRPGGVTEWSLAKLTSLPRAVPVTQSAQAAQPG